MDRSRTEDAPRHTRITLTAVVVAEKRGGGLHRERVVMTRVLDDNPDEQDVHLLGSLTMANAVSALLDTKPPASATAPRRRRG